MSGGGGFLLVLSDSENSVGGLIRVRVRGLKGFKLRGYMFHGPRV